MLVAARRLPNSPTLARELLAGSEPFVDVLDWLAGRIAAADGSLSDWQATDAAAERLDALIAAIDSELSAARARAVATNYVWQGDRHSGCLVHVAELPGGDGLAAANRIALRQRMLEDMRRPDFGDARFERVCRALLRTYGADPEQADVTRLSGDGGIDFWGIYRPDRASGPRRLATQPYRVAGQAKRWANPVPKNDVEVFTSRLGKWRLGAGGGWASLPAWFRANELPVLGLFVGLSGFQRPAESVAAEGMCVCLDGLTICEDLSYDPIVVAHSTSSNEDFCESLFRDYFDAAR